MAITRRVEILAKVETTYNVDASPAAGTDALLVEEPTFAPTGQRMHERDQGRSSLAALQAIYGGSLWQITLKVSLKHSGTVDTPPDWGPLMRACGTTETINATTSVVYTPASSGHDSITIHYYEDGKRYAFTGCRGTFTLEATAGEPAKITFTLTGHLAGVIDSALPSVTIDGTNPVAFSSAGVSVLGYSGVFSSLSMDGGLNVVTPPSANASDGYGEIRITSRKVTGSIDPEDTLIATKDFINEWQSGSTGALNTGVIGSTAGNRWQLQMPKVFYMDVAPGDRDGIRTMELSYQALESSGDDEWSLTLT